MRTSRALAGMSAAGMLFALTTPPAQAQQQYPVVYAGTSNSTVTRIDLESGCIDWVKALPNGGVVNCVAACRDGDPDTPPVLAATADWTYLLDGAGALYSGTPLGVSGSAYHQISPIAIDTQGEYAVIAHSDKTVRLYHIQQNPLSLSLVWQDDFDGRSVAIDGVGRHLAVAGPDGVAYYDHLGDGSSGWSSSDGDERWSYPLVGSSGPLDGLTVAITPGGSSGSRYVAVGSDAKTVFLYDEAGNSVWTYDSPRGQYMSVALDYDGELVACSNDDPSDQKGAQLDGRPTSAGTPWTFVPDNPKLGDDCYALAAQHYDAPPGERNWFASGGSGRYGVFVHDTQGSLVYSGNPARQRHRLAVFDYRLAGHTYVVTADISKPEVHVYKTDQKNPRHVVTIDGNCRALSTAWGPEVGPAGQQCPIGTRYCLAGTNSAGDEACMYAVGSNLTSEADLTLLATGCTPGMAGIFFYGLTQAQIPFQYGFLCVQPPFWRIPVVAPTGTIGAASLHLTSAVAPAGTSVHFQFWYRDTLHPTKARTSDAVSVTFQ